MFLIEKNNQELNEKCDILVFLAINLVVAMLNQLENMVMLAR